MSPVSDGYKKKGLIEGKHRCEMVRLGLKNNDWVRMNTFEADNPEFLPTLLALNYYKKYLDEAHGRDIRVMLLCGGDLVETFTVPNLWKTEHVQLVMQFILI
jgi:nicotinamide mononucleotide adenylyltransferase